MKDKIGKKKEKKKLRHQSPLTNVHVIYEKWVISTRGEFNEFKELYEITMIRSMSEAMAETVGSMMNSHCGKGRHLQPVNFSMELVLRFNLGPLHLMDKLIEEVLKSQNKEYVRRVQRKDKLIMRDVNVSAAVKTFRQQSEQYSRFPTEFWTEWKNN